MIKLKNLGQQLKPNNTTMSNPLSEENIYNTNNMVLSTNNLYNTLYKSLESKKSNTLDSNISSVKDSPYTNLTVYDNKYKTLSYKLRLLKDKNNQDNFSRDKDLFNNITLNKYVSIKELNVNNTYAVPYLNNSVSDTMINNKFFDKSAQNIGQTTFRSEETNKNFLLKKKFFCLILFIFI